MICSMVCLYHSLKACIHVTFDHTFSIFLVLSPSLEVSEYAAECSLEVSGYAAEVPEFIFPFIQYAKVFSMNAR
jgi:hypothetical protein